MRGQAPDPVFIGFMIPYAAMLPRDGGLKETVTKPVAPSSQHEELVLEFKKTQKNILFSAPCLLGLLLSLDFGEEFVERLLAIGGYLCIDLHEVRSDLV